MAQWPYSTAAWQRLRRLNGEAPCRRSVLPPTAWHRPRHPPESESRMAFAVVASVFHRLRPRVLTAGQLRPPAGLIPGAVCLPATNGVNGRQVITT